MFGAREDLGGVCCDGCAGAVAEICGNHGAVVTEGVGLYEVLFDGAASAVDPDYDLCAVEGEGFCGFGEVSVVAGHDSDACEVELKGRV